jgi:hypothetical protein
MYGVLPQLQLVATIIMFLSLMIIANLFGFTCCVANLKYFSVSVISKVLLSDNLIEKMCYANRLGGEYQVLNSFFQCMGISYHVSCPHAHQQNGSAERKHRHIVKIGLTFLAHATMLLKF